MLRFYLAAVDLSALERKKRRSRRDSLRITDNIRESVRSHPREKEDPVCQSRALVCVTESHDGGYPEAE